MIFAILTHLLNSISANNYFARAEGQLFCLDGVTQRHVPLAPLDTCAGDKVGPIPRLSNSWGPASFYMPLPLLGLTTLRSPEMTCGDGGLYAVDLVTSKMQIRNSKRSIFPGMIPGGRA